MKDDFCFFTKEEYEGWLKNYMKLSLAVQKMGAGLQEATEAVIAMTKAIETIQGVPINEIQVEK
jgi:hypothetical protein